MSKGDTGDIKSFLNFLYFCILNTNITMKLLRRILHISECLLQTLSSLEIRFFIPFNAFSLYMRMRWLGKEKLHLYALIHWCLIRPIEIDKQTNWFVYPFLWFLSIFYLSGIGIEIWFLSIFMKRKLDGYYSGSFNQHSQSIVYFPQNCACAR